MKTIKLALLLLLALVSTAHGQISGPRWQCSGTNQGAVSTVNVTGSCSYANGTLTISGGGGGGSVTSLTCGSGVTCTPSNPITSTGTIALTSDSTTVGGAACTLGSSCTPSTTIGGTICNLGSSCSPATTVNGQSCALGSTCTISTAPSGAAGGDLAGTYPNPTVAKGTFTGSSSASGSASFDLSGANGVFKTSTGTVTIGPGTVNLTGTVNLGTGLVFNAGPNTIIGTVADKVDPVNIAGAGQATGDQWVASSSTLGSLVHLGSAGRVWTVNSAGTTVSFSDVITIRADLTPGTSGTGDTTVITFPSGLGTNTNGILLSDLTVRVRQAIVSSNHTGQTVVTVGTSAGGTEYLLSQTITDSTGAGTIYGLDTTTVGSAFTVGNMFNAVAAGASSVIIRTVTSGTVGTPCLLTLHLNAEVL